MGHAQQLQSPPPNQQARLPDDQPTNKPKELSGLEVAADAAYISAGTLIPLTIFIFFLHAPGSPSRLHIGLMCNAVPFGTSLARLGLNRRLREYPIFSEVFALIWLMGWFVFSVFVATPDVEMAA